VLKLVSLAYEIVCPALLLACCWLAWRRGERMEQLGAGLFVLASVATLLVDSSRFARLETGVLVVDAALAAGLLAMAIAAASFWPMWAAGFQLVSVSFHFGTLLVPGATGWVYAVAVNFWSIPVMLSLVLGCMAAPSRRCGSGPADPGAGHGIGNGVG
jgi:hypothetical protein